jgi:DNA mismatch repair protein MutL
MTARIQQLSDETINRIAAGEVVEGPASVVKELVENSLDAGATRVEVEVDQGGTRLIRVVDDGHGMPPEDARLCLERHATSKLRAATDLHSIRTMGFRGEAVPSIASVSRFTLVTRPPEADKGLKIEVHGGKLVSEEAAAARPGTRIEVRHLFYNTPARRKFQRSPGAEQAAIRELMGDFVLARPDVAFRLTKSGEPILATPGELDLAQALERVLETGEVKHFVPLEAATHPELPFTVSGYLAGPAVTRRNSRGLRLFVNGRPFYAPTLCRGVLEAYRNFLPKGRWPAGVLLIEADPRAVDVNVHPQKKEVRFTGYPKLLSWLGDRIRAGLEEGAEIRHEEVGAPVAAAPAAPDPEALLQAVARGEDPREAPAGPEPYRPPRVERLKPRGVAGAAATQQALRLFDPAPYKDLGKERKDLVGAGAQECQLGVRSGEGAQPAGELFPDGVRVLGQVFDSFMLVTDENSVYYVDQHVAHERVLFEHFQDAFERAEPVVQNLLVPPEIPLREGHGALLEENLERLERYGFRLHVEGDTAYLEAVPIFPKAMDVMGVLQDVIEGLGEIWSGDPVHDEIEAMADMMSCKAAIKAGERMSAGEMTVLLEQLFDCRYPLTCPHGRPILLEVSEAELRRRFLRSG